MESFLFITMIVCILFLIIDFRQTTKIAENPNRWSEMNPILGPHPSTNKVRVYFMLVILFVLSIPYIIKYIPIGPWQDILSIAFIASTGFEIFVVWRNTKFGLGI